MVLLHNPDLSKTNYGTSLVTTLTAIHLPPPPKCSHALIMPTFKNYIKKRQSKISNSHFSPQNCLEDKDSKMAEANSSCGLALARMLLPIRMERGDSFAPRQEAYLNREFSGNGKWSPWRLQLGQRTRSSQPPGLD